VSSQIDYASHSPIDKPSKYKQLLRTSRLRDTTETRDADLETLSDKGRIVRSAPFRRLQSKAQVFSMARTGTVRTRLTHSLESSNYGELIGETLARKLVETKSLPPDLRFSFVQTVENACLLHDIGNPPFGHMGEYAIKQWFERHWEELERRWQDLPGIRVHLDAYKRFDGNPHGLRIVARLQWLNDEYGMNLTCALLASYLKYLGGNGSKFTKKIGYFPSEVEVVKGVWQVMGLATDSSGLPVQRHPLSFVMEAADDIAYCLSDIEDAIERRVVTEREFLDWMRNKNVDLDTHTQESQKGNCGALMANSTYHFFRLWLSRELVQRAADAYIKNEGRILDGSMDKSLFATDGEATKWLDLLKEFSSSKVYRSREAIETELAGLNAITGLLNAYKDIMTLKAEEFEALSPSKKSDRAFQRPILSLLYSLLPEKHRLAYECCSEKIPKLEPVSRIQLVVDYVAGMTDSHVLKIYNMINGSQQFGLE
jgi:dGTPase